MNVAKPCGEAVRNEPAETFSPALKACRDILVDDVARHLGVPIIGRAAPTSIIGRADVLAARRRLATALAYLDDDTVARAPHVRASRDHLVAVDRLLAAATPTTAPTSDGARRLRLARRRLAAAIDHLTTVMFADPA